jgi:hypothetical protein
MLAMSDLSWLTEDSLAIIGVFSIPIVAIVGGLWYKIRTVTSENDLKRAMVERGMSAEEIERVLGARAPERKH